MTFPDDQIYCVYDFETYSEASLKAVGGYEYSNHHSTEILCAAWRIGTRETLRQKKTRRWVPRLGVGEPDGLVAALLNPKIVKVAHNAFFEQVITRNTLAKMLLMPELQDIQHTEFLCTASLAAVLALPRKLEKACKVLKLPVQKDMEGHRLMLKMAKPRKPSKHNPSTRHLDPGDLNRLGRYCVTDVDAEVELLLRVPPLTKTERRVWELDQAINLRGFQVDRKLVAATQKLVNQELKNLSQRVSDITFGEFETTNRTAALKDFLEAEGCFLPNLQKKTLEDALSSGMAQGVARELIEIRLASAKTSTAKYDAFDLRSRTDGRLRDILMYHGASTGRWAALGVQPHNLPRPKFPYSELQYALKLIREGDLEGIRLCFGDPMAVFSSALRSMIKARMGHTLSVGDYAAIEARVLFWVADHHEGMRAFRDDRDLYKELATKIFGVKLAKVDGDQRFVGKTATLGCGFAMGDRKFRESCKALGKDVSAELAKKAVMAYRAAHKPVVKLWGNIERAAVAAVNNLGKRYSINHTTWWVEDGFLWCKLPSGRKLAYHKPTVRHEPTPWGEKRPVLYHWSVHPKTKQWVNGKTYGGKLVENVVQAIARDLMAAAMLRIEKAGPWRVVLTVHDELLGEQNVFLAREKYGSKANDEFLRLMAKLPKWAKGLPCKVEGYECDRYRKG